MPPGRYCTICKHPEITDINKRLLAGDTLEVIGDEYGFSSSALCRHRQNHMSLALKAAYQERGVVPVHVAAGDLVDQVNAIMAKTLSILDRAEAAEAKAKTAHDQDRSRRTALSAIREARNTMELLAKLVGELSTGPTINVLVSAEWVDLRTQILQAVEPYPEARLAIVEAVCHELEE